MDAVLNNPFRILGVPITASEREIAKQINTLATYVEMGKKKTFDTDLHFLSSIDRTAHIVEEAKKQIEQSESKFLYSLFWFWNNNSVDGLALEVLKEGNTSKAIGIWEKTVFTNKNKVYLSKVLIENLIRHSTNWSNQKDEVHSLTKNDGVYIIGRKIETGSSIPSVYAELNFDGNWTIDCEAEWHAGVDNGGYGIIFGRNDSSYFTFQISGNGQYTFGKFIEWNYTQILEWKEDGAINKWSKNQIQIKKVENILCFIVNGIFLNTWHAEPFFGKFFGFKVTNNQKISFKNFKFCELVENEIYGEGINVTSRNFSSLKNLSTLYLSLAANNGSLQLDYFKKGIALAKTFFASERIEDYSTLIAGERYIYNPEKALHFYINDIINSLKNYIEKSGGISTSQFINAFSSFPLEAKQFLNNRFVSRQIQNIDKEIEIADTLRKRTAATATETGNKLFTNTKADIEYLKNIIGESDFQFQIIGDKLSLAVVQCGIDAFNFCKDANGEIDYPKAIKSEEDYQQEYEFALNIAVTQRAKERAKENLDSCLSWIKQKHLYYCWFCGNNPSENISKFEITLYKETSRSYFPRKVQYKYVPVSILRCGQCKKVHRESSNEYIAAFMGCLFVGFIIGILADGYWFAGLIGGGISGWILVEILRSNQNSKNEIKSTSHSSIKEYPALGQMIKEGWTFSKPIA